MILMTTKHVPGIGDAYSRELAQNGIHQVKSQSFYIASYQKMNALSNESLQICLQKLKVP